MWSCGRDVVQSRAQFNPPELRYTESGGMLHARSLSTGECCLLIISALGRQVGNEDPWGSWTGLSSLIAESQATATPSQEKDD